MCHDLSPAHKNIRIIKFNSAATELMKAGKNPDRLYNARVCVHSPVCVSVCVCLRDVIG